MTTKKPFGHPGQGLKEGKAGKNPPGINRTGGFKPAGPAQMGGQAHPVEAKQQRKEVFSAKNRPKPEYGEGLL